MLTSRRSILMAGLAAMTIAGGHHAWALNEGQAKAHVEATINDLRALLRTEGTATSRAPELRRIMEERANLPRLAQFSAGRTWREMDADQRTRFVIAFSTFVSETYARRFDEYSGDPQIAVGRAIDAGRKGILVETPIAQPDGQPITVSWLVSDRGGRVEIVDLVIEGISMAATQRDEIAQMLKTRNGDIEQLIDDLGT